MKLSRTVLFALALASALSTGSALGQQQEIKCSPKFDKNGNGVIEDGDELRICILHSTYEHLRKFDSNADGTLDQSEQLALNDAEEFVTALIDARDIIGGTAGIPVTPKTDGTKPPDDGKRFVAKNGFMLRSAYEAIGVLTAPKDPKKASGAQIGYVYNADNDEYTANLSGAVELFQSWRIKPDSTGRATIPPGTLREAAAVVGAEFNRKINSASPAKDINSLTFRAGGEVGIQGWGREDYHFFRSSIFDATDFDFYKQVVGAEFEYQPVYDPWGIGQFKPIMGSPVEYRWRPILHLEYQNVLDAGGSAELAQASDYLFAGPVLTGELSFGLPLFIDVKYWAMWDLLGNADPFQYLEVGANWDLDKEGHAALTAKYRNGNIPKTRQPVNDVTLGLTVKY